jgi:hypothetical protein
MRLVGPSVAPPPNQRSLAISALSGGCNTGGDNVITRVRSIEGRNDAIKRIQAGVIQGARRREVMMRSCHQ